MSVRLSIRTEQIDSHIGGIFAKYDIWVFFQHLPTKFKVH
jgi:hypothetical protein